MNVQTQLSLIERECNRFQDQLEDLVQPEWPGEVQRVVRCIHVHLFDPESQIGSICARCDITSGRFQLRFKRHCCTTMRQYREEMRMLAALRLLMMRDLDIGFIAFGIGYENYRTFGRAFKRYFEDTPSKLRDRINGRPLVSERIRTEMTAGALQRLLGLSTDSKSALPSTRPLSP